MSNCIETVRHALRGRRFIEFKTQDGVIHPSTKEPVKIYETKPDNTTECIMTFFRDENGRFDPWAEQQIRLAIGAKPITFKTKKVYGTRRAMSLRMMKAHRFIDHTGINSKRRTR